MKKNKKTFYYCQFFT